MTDEIQNQAAPTAPIDNRDDAQTADQAAAQESVVDVVEKGLAEARAQEETKPEPQAAAADPKPADPKPADPAADKPALDEAALLDGVKNDRQRERIQGFIEQHKETTAELEKIKPQLEEALAEKKQWYDTIQSTGTNPEQLAETFQFLRVLNSPDPKDKGQALEILKGLYQTLATELGVDAPGVDVLAADPTLQQKIEAGELDRQTAISLVQARREAELLRAQQQRLTEQQQQTAQASQQEAATNAALDQVNALYDELRQNDPDFERKRQYLARTVAPMLSQTTPPDQWAAAYRKAYDDLGAMIPRGLPAGARPISGNRNGGGGTAVAKPTSAVEAVMQGLGMTG